METKPTHQAEEKSVTSKEVIAYLAEKFPACFSITGAAKPLKIGIFQDLAERLAEDDFVSKTRLRQSLRHYTSSWRYLKSVKLGSHRVDLDGNQVAEIDQEQADYATKTLQESQEKFANKKAQDKTAKKPYKGTKAERKHSDKKLAPKNDGKFKSVKSTKGVKKPSPVKLKPIETSAITTGTKVKVQLGNAAMDATVTEVVGKDVSVQLTSGMVVKTQVENLFTE